MLRSGGPVEYRTSDLIFWYIQEQVTNIKLEFVTTILIVFGWTDKPSKAFVISRPAIGSSEIFPNFRSLLAMQYLSFYSSPVEDLVLVDRVFKHLRCKWQT